MKKIVCLFLAAVLMFAFCSCSSEMTAAEDFLIALKQMNIDAMKQELIPETEAGSLYTKLDTSLTEAERAVLQKLYGLTQYTVGEVIEEDGARFVSMTLKTPNAKRIAELADKQILVSAESAENIVSDMIDGGTVAKTLMTEKTVSVKMTEKDGAWLVDYEAAENAAFRETLAISEILNFILAN